MAHMDYRQFSDNQQLNNLDSTGEVSEETWDLEEIGSDSLPDDQAIGGVLVTLMEDTSVTGGDEGLLIEVRTAAAEALASGYEIVGARSILPAEVVAGKQIWVPFWADIAQKELGLWFKAVSTAFVGDIYVDADYQAQPVVKNEAIQKVPS